MFLPRRLQIRATPICYLCKKASSITNGKIRAAPITNAATVSETLWNSTICNTRGSRRDRIPRDEFRQIDERIGSV